MTFGPGQPMTLNDVAPNKRSSGGEDHADQFEIEKHVHLHLCRNLDCRGREESVKKTA